MSIAAEHISQRAALNELDTLSPEAQTAAIQWWLPRLVKEIYGDHVDDNKDGIKAELRQLKKWAMLGGTVAIILQIIQTVCTVASTFHPHISIGGP